MANFERYQFTVTDTLGRAVAGAEITVQQEVANFPAAVLYSDPAGAVPIGNPFLSDAEGFAYFHAAAGQYKITARANGFTRIWRYVRVGIAEVTLAIQQTYSTTTADADPGAGIFRLNNADPASATAIYIDNVDHLGRTITGWLDSFDDNNDTSNRGILELWDIDDPTAWRKYKVSGSVVDGTGYRKLTIAHLAGGGTFSGLVALVFIPINDKGSVSGPVSAVDGEIVLFNGTSGAALKRASTTGVLKAASGVLAQAVSGTDYQAPIGTISGIAKGNGANALTAATAGTDYMKPDTTSNLTKGFTATTYDIGTPTNGSTVTLDGTNGQLQKLTNNVAGFTIAAPSSDTEIDILVTNGASAGTITFSGFTAPSGGGGDSYNTTNTNKFRLHIERIGGVSSYSWKAYQ